MNKVRTYLTGGKFKLVPAVALRAKSACGRAGAAGVPSGKAAAVECQVCNLGCGRLSSFRPSFYHSSEGGRERSSEKYKVEFASGIAVVIPVGGRGGVDCELGILTWPAVRERGPGRPRRPAPGLHFLMFSFCLSFSTPHE